VVPELLDKVILAVLQVQIQMLVVAAVVPVLLVVIHLIMSAVMAVLDFNTLHGLLQPQQVMVDTMPEAVVVPITVVPLTELVD
jgi:hypothetical protein